MFTDEQVIEKIRLKLPRIFRIAELEATRDKKIGMEVGSLRERILVSLLIDTFGKENIEIEIPITYSETDVIVFDIPYSIKTLSNSLSGLKLIWTVDAKKSLEFAKKYKPSCDMIFVFINWDKIGGVYLIPKEVQTKIFNELGRSNYMKLPKEGTNPRGIEMRVKALRKIMTDNKTQCITIDWKKEQIDFDNLERWIELWKEE